MQHLNLALVEGRERRGQLIADAFIVTSQGTALWVTGCAKLTRLSVSTTVTLPFVKAIKQSSGEV